jgi:hypothetical protein
MVSDMRPMSQKTDHLLMLHALTEKGVSIELSSANQISHHCAIYRVQGAVGQQYIWYIGTN